MHPELAKLLGQYHEQALLDEAAKERLVVLARAHARRGLASDATPAWRRTIGWSLIDLGVRLAGGPIGPAVERR